jgi:hypothetical protein
LPARHRPHELDDHLLHDIGLLRDQIQPPLLTGLFANRSLALVAAAPRCPIPGRFEGENE